ncbi:hypothetical protein MSLAZ_2080 [Methanosarcina lacustris Z-7289]|uniref:Novel STAND NTPase 3 domain-containing protein n=1 Tax=Methanosarcina lacustris Z-7289 TaxID=1434111 RepID=A0A0E3S4Z4_9EURY|nr:hypothetical protein [Methanosarcina lacustris]AKB75341.1 hypothetical protein MSLAZ_2080 [Methanosarcina lacustris Z-7289]
MAKMSEKEYYLAYIDILGFDKLAQEISEESNLSSDFVRKIFVKTIEEKMCTLKEQKRILTYQKHSGDSWILISDRLSNLFRNIYEILDVQLPFKNHKHLQFEIGLGKGIFGDQVEFDKEDVVNKNDTINFLNTYLLKKYSDWHKITYKKSVMSSYVVFTEELFQELNPFDKEICDLIEYTYKEKENVERTEVLNVANLNKFISRAKCLEFLDLLGISENYGYDRIDKLYVPSTGFQEIKSSLEKNKILFLTGPSEYGKTYTSLKILWDYFIDGYTPVWIRGDEKIQRLDVRNRLQNIENELNAHHIFYFEDPFGKSEYEAEESIERELTTILEVAKNAEDAYIIITSKQSIFEELKSKNNYLMELKKYEKMLGIEGKPYDITSKKQILFNWAKLRECDWVENDDQRNLISEHLKYEFFTPLKIKEFCRKTYNTKDTEVLIKWLKHASEETSINFANEVKGMSDDKKLFLSFLFISPSFEEEFIKKTYVEMLEELSIETAWNFESIIEFFASDKVEIYCNRIRFFHSSYYRSLLYLLSENGQLTSFSKNVFSKLLLKLSTKNKATKYVIRTIGDNYNNLSEEIQNLLFDFAKKDGNIKFVAGTIAYNYNNLPRRPRHLLFNLARDKKASRYVGESILRNFNKLPEDVQNLIFEFVENEEIGGYVVRSITENYSDLPPKIQGLLIKAHKEGKFEEQIARGISENFKILPKNIQDLLYELADDEDKSVHVAKAVADKFENLPKEAREKLILKLHGKRKNDVHVARAIIRNFETVPDRIQFLIFEMIENNETAEYISPIILSNLNKLPEDVAQDILFELTRKDIAVAHVLRAIFNNYYILSKDAQNLLFNILEKNKFDSAVTKILLDNYSKLPETGKKSLFKLLDEGKLNQKNTKSLKESKEYKNYRGLISMRFVET